MAEARKPPRKKPNSGPPQPPPPERKPLSEAEQRKLDRDLEEFLRNHGIV